MDTWLSSIRLSFSQAFSTKLEAHDVSWCISFINFPSLGLRVATLFQHDVLVCKVSSMKTWFVRLTLQGLDLNPTKHVWNKWCCDIIKALVAELHTDHHSHAPNIWWKVFQKNAGSYNGKKGLNLKWDVLQTFGLKLLCPRQTLDLFFM